MGVLGQGEAQSLQPRLVDSNAARTEVGLGLQGRPAVRCQGPQPVCGAGSSQHTPGQMGCLRVTRGFGEALPKDGGRTACA